MELKTPLYDTHVETGGKIVPFAGYLLPVQYPTGVITEHMAVREKAGLFDVSHMGEVLLSGPDALANVNYLLTNDFTNLQENRIRYSPMCYEDGGIIDDLLVYHMEEDCYLLVVNASNRYKDVEWIRAHLFGDVTMEDISDSVAQLALQGPNSQSILEKLAHKSELPTKYYTFSPCIKVAGIDCLISQTGYTGEHGYELYCRPDKVVALWNSLLEAGKEEGLIPCGLGARDTLRLEASMPLYGHEMSEKITPLEANLDFSVKMQKEDFLGKQGLLNRGEPTRTRVGIKVTGRGIAREECPILLDEVQIGITTSGTHCPYLKGAYAMALVDKEVSAVGTKVLIDIRGRKTEAEIISLPFYKRSY